MSHSYVVHLSAGKGQMGQAEKSGDSSARAPLVNKRRRGRRDVAFGGSYVVSENWNCGTPRITR